MTCWMSNVNECYPRRFPHCRQQAVTWHITRVQNTNPVTLNHTLDMSIQHWKIKGFISDPQGGGGEHFADPSPHIFIFVFIWDYMESCLGNSKKRRNLNDEKCITTQSPSPQIACVGYRWVRWGRIGQPGPHRNNRHLFVSRNYS